MDNSIENINNSVKKVGSLDDLLDFTNTANGKKKSNIYIPKCLCGFSDIQLLGSGAFSVVFSAYHLLDKNTYALKCIPLPDKKPGPLEIMEGIDSREKFVKFIEELTDREAKILKLYYGIVGREHTLEELGGIFDLTRERVRQIKKKGLNKLARRSSIEEYL